MDEVARRVELAPAIAELVSKASIHGLESSKALAVTVERRASDRWNCGISCQI